MKGLRWKGAMIVAAAVIGFQWYVEANPVEAQPVKESVVTSTLSKVEKLPSSLPVAQVSKKVIPSRNWGYHYEHDELRHVYHEYGANTSENAHRFAFPYDRDTRLSIETLSFPVKARLKAGHVPVKGVFLTINNGQFECGYDGCFATVSFDGGKVERFRLSMSLTNPNNVLYMIDGQRFLREARKHHTAIIEVDFFQSGSRQFRFNLEDETTTTYSS